MQVLLRSNRFGLFPKSVKLFSPFSPSQSTGFGLYISFNQPCRLYISALLGFRSTHRQLASAESYSFLQLVVIPKQSQGETVTINNHMVHSPSEEPPPKKGWRKFLQDAGNLLFKYKDKGEWLKDMRGNLSLVATVIATMTFQLAMNPPGGVLQADENTNFKCPNEDASHPCPGEAVLAVRYHDEYFNFLLFNTIAFVASLGVCLLLVSGLPLNHRFPVWLLSVGMCITLTSLALTYLFGAAMVTPDAIWDRTANILSKVLRIWILLLGVVGVFLTIRFVVWVVNKTKKCINKRNKSTTPRDNRQVSVNDG